jgi:hypothetical protein
MKECEDIQWFCSRLHRIDLGTVKSTRAKKEAPVEGLMTGLIRMPGLMPGLI